MVYIVHKLHFREHLKIHNRLFILNLKFNLNIKRLVVVTKFDLIFLKVNN